MTLSSDLPSRSFGLGESPVAVVPSTDLVAFPSDSTSDLDKKVFARL